MKIKNRILSVVLVISLLLTFFVSTLFVTALTQADHIVGNATPPTETSETGFTVSVTTENCYVEATNNYWQRFSPEGELLGYIENFFFVTGDPAKAALHGTIIQIVRDSGTYDAEVIYTSRVDVAMSDLHTSPDAAWNNYVIENVSHLPREFHWNAGLAARANSTWFLDSGRFTDPLSPTGVGMDRPWLDSNGLSGPNLSVIGLSECPVSGDPIVGGDVATIVRIPAPCRPHTGTAGTPATQIAGQGERPRPARYRILSFSQYFENLIFDGQGLDMMPANGFGSGSDRGQYMVVIQGTGGEFDDYGTRDLVFRDIIFQNVGASTTVPSFGFMTDISLGTNRDQVNTPLQVIRSVAGTRHFENLTFRNNRVTAGVASQNNIIRFNNSANTFFRDITIEDTVAHVNSHPIGILSGSTPETFVGPHMRDMGNIIFDGSLIIPNRNHANDAIFIQDYRYHNIRVPSTFGWAQMRTQNGAGSTPAIRVYNHKRAPITGFVPFELNTGYFYVEAAVTSPNLQTQLNNINTMINAANTQINNKNTAAGETLITNLAPNIKVIANNSGELGGFTVPNFAASANIVALHQTATPATSLNAAVAHASGANPAENAPEWVTFTGARGALALPATNETRTITLFNLDFRTQAEWTITDATTGDPDADPDPIAPGITNFATINSGRNLFLRYVVVATFYDVDDNVIGEPQILTPGTAPTVPNVTVPPGFDLRWTVNDGTEQFTSEQINNTSLDESANFHMVLVPRNDITYTVNYFIYGTTTPLAESVTRTGQTMGATVTENALNISGWTATQSTQSLTLAATGNVITFYYQPIMIPVTFTPGANGALAGGDPNVVIYVQYGTALTADDIPAVIANAGWAHSGWASANPLGFVVTEAVTFTAQYEELADTDTVTIEGRKIWNHGRNPASERPQSITIILLANGEYYKSFALSEDDHWRWSFELNKYDTNGNLIVWTVDEEYVRDYRKSINGFDITNTHISVTDTNWQPPGNLDPNDPGADVPITGDNNNIALWMSAMTVSSTGLIAMVILQKRKNRGPRRANLNG